MLHSFQNTLFSQNVSLATCAPDLGKYLNKLVDSVVLKRCYISLHSTVSKIIDAERVSRMIGKCNVTRDENILALCDAKMLLENITPHTEMALHNFARHLLNHCYVTFYVNAGL